jgi:hypothetical protein
MMQMTNTFSHLRTEYEGFRTAKGEEVYDVERWKRHSVMGIIETLKAGGV